MVTGLQISVSMNAHSGYQELYIYITFCVLASVTWCNVLYSFAWCSRNQYFISSCIGILFPSMYMSHFISLVLQLMGIWVSTLLNYGEWCLKHSRTNFLCGCFVFSLC